MKKYNGPSSSQLSLPVRNRAGNGNREVFTITEMAMQRSYDTGGLESIDSFSCPLVMMLPTPTGSSGWGVLCYVCMGGIQAGRVDHLRVLCY